MSSTAQRLGQIGVPMPVRKMAQKTWDVIVVGAGHNALTCAAYLAQAGKSVLVLEARDRIGGANTMEEPWPGVRMSPCAYVSGLLHPRVIRELKLVERGYHFTPATGLFVPFEDGTSLFLSDLEPEQAEAEIRALAPRDVEGYRAMLAAFERCNAVVRADADDGTWASPPPSRAELEAKLGADAEARGLLFEWSIAQMVEHYFTDERLRAAYLGQGIIGTRFSPFHPGTASIYYYHYCGSQGGLPGVWGYVRGGMGMVSFLLCDAAQEAGAVVAAGLPVARIFPGEGVELASGERLNARAVVSGADPRVTLRLLGQHARPEWQTQVEAMPIEGATAKLSVLLRELPNFTARPGTWQPHHLATVNAPLTPAEWHASHAAMLRGEVAERVWAEIYFQTAHDDSVAPPGQHTMSVFAQYVPYTLAHSTWDTRREEIGQIILNSIARFCSNLPEAVIGMEVMGPPDIERKVGLTGGHIFQGELLPEFMWEKRLAYRTPMPTVYLCGACTHPGGGVVAINGRNAALQILADL